MTDYQLVALAQLGYNGMAILTNSHIPRGERIISPPGYPNAIFVNPLDISEIEQAMWEHNYWVRMDAKWYAGLVGGLLLGALMVLIVGGL